MPSPNNNEIESAYEECARLTRASGTNFMIGILTLPPDLRKAIYATYAFCRLCDDIVDEPEPGVDPAEELVKARLALDGAAETPYSDHPVFIAVRHTIEGFELDQRHYIDIIDGCEMDLSTSRYETFDDLRVYCYKVASAVGIITVSIFGTKSPDAIAFADELGVAFQLTNILRDVKEDFNNGRIYLPQDELRQFEVDDTELGGTAPSDQFREMMRFQIERAQRFYDSGTQVLPLLKRGRLPVELANGFYSRLLVKIQKRQGDVLSSRVSLSKTEKITIAAMSSGKSLLGSVTR